MKTKVKYRWPLNFQFKIESYRFFLMKKEIITFQHSQGPGITVLDRN